MSQPVLVIATPRSGTNNCANYYRSKGLKVTHESVAPDADMAVDYHQLQNLSEFPVAIYLTREPVTNVKSLSGLLERRGQYRRTLELFPELPIGLSPLELAYHYWLRVHQSCTHLPALRAESLPIVGEQVINADHREGPEGLSGHQLQVLRRAAERLGYGWQWSVEHNNAVGSSSSP